MIFLLIFKMFDTLNVPLTYHVPFWFPGLSKLRYRASRRGGSLAAHLGTSIRIQGELSIKWPMRFIYNAVPSYKFDGKAPMIIEIQ